MLKRTIAISLLLLLSVGIILPFVDSNAHGVRQSYQIGPRKHHRYRSRAWWRRYRARLRRKRAAAMELAHRNALINLPANLNLGNFVAVAPPTPQVATNAVNNAAPVSAPRVTAMAATAPSVPTPPAPTVSAPTVSAAKLNTTRSHAASPTATVVTSISPTPMLINTPVVVNTPATPKAVAEARPVNETRLRPKNPVSPLPGELSIAVVALSRPNPAFLTAREEAKLLAGVNFTDLRRIVIDRMVTAGGWVTNDYVREINGGRVFVVTARTPRNGQTPEKAWTFYFTESGGRIYSLTTDSPIEHTDRMGKEAERFIGTLRSTPTQEEKE